MAFEKRWPTVAVQLFTANGSADGRLETSDTRAVKVKQKILLKSNTQTTLLVEVKRVISKTVMYVGLINDNIDGRVNISNFTVVDGANFSNLDDKQPRPKIGIEDFARAVYEEEPACAIRTMGVDQLGNAWNELNPTPALMSFIRNGAAQQVLEDQVIPSNNRPLPVKLSGVQGDVVIEATNLNLAVQLEGEYNAVDNPKPDSIGTVYHERGLTQDRTKQTRRTTAIRGTVDTDTVSQDVSLHDRDGNGITSTLSGSKRRLNSDNDGVYDGTNNTDPANVGIVQQTRNAVAADSRQVERPTAKRGTTDTDTVSSDVSLHDHSGNQFTETNQFPVNSSIRDGSNPSLKVTVNAANELETDNDSIHTRNEAFNKSTAISGELNDTSTIVATEGNISPVRITPQRALHANLRNNSGKELLGRQLPSNSIPVIKAQTPTYSAAIGALVTAGAATDIFTITGSATKTIRITRIRIGGNSTTATWHIFLGIKRSTANTGGTSTVLTRVPHDSLNAAATATIRAYTANPTLGTTVGTL